MPKTKYPDVTHLDLYKFFVETLSSDYLDTAESRGYLWNYKLCPGHPHKKDDKALQAVSGLCLSALTKWPHGLFTKPNIRKALEKLERDTKRSFSGKVCIDMQSYCWSLFFQDIRMIQRDSLTGTKLPSYIQALIAALKKSDGDRPIRIQDDLCLLVSET